MRGLAAEGVQGVAVSPLVLARVNPGNNDNTADATDATAWNDPTNSGATNFPRNGEELSFRIRWWFAWRDDW